MKKTTKRQINYRRRIRLQHTLISLAAYVKSGKGDLSVNEFYKELLEQWVLLQTNKGAIK